MTGVQPPSVVLLGSGPDWYVSRFRDPAWTLHHLPDGDTANLAPGVADQVQAVIASRPVDAGLIAALPRLRLIAIPGAGYERIDLEAARARGVTVVNAPGTTDGCVADMAFALLLAVARRIVAGDRYVREGRWPGGVFSLAPRLHGRRMGILGLGGIGMAIARRAAGFDIPVSYHNRRPRPDVAFRYHATPRDLAAAVDVLMIACPGGAATRHLVDAQVLEALGPRGIVLNIARGTVVDEDALIRALENGAIAGAGLDVFEHEPQVPARLLALDNVVLMPHRAGGTVETWEDVCDAAKAALHALFRGDTLPGRVA